MSKFTKQMLWLIGITTLAFGVFFGARYLGASYEGAALAAALAVIILAFGVPFVTYTALAAMLVALAATAATLAIVFNALLAATSAALVAIIAAVYFADEVDVSKWRLATLYLGWTAAIGFGIFLMSLPIALLAIALPLLAVLAHRSGVLFVPER